MAKFELREGQGTLFKNADKKTDKHPDYRGECKVGGTEFWLSAWIKQGKNGKFMSLSIQAKGSKPAKSSFDDMEDDVPF